MGKKDKKTKKGGEGETISPEPISPFGKKVIWGGVAVVVLGFCVLALADPMGRNWAARLSPFLILGGYAAIGLGIFWDDPEPARDSAVPPPVS